jgi:hypothetical protein
MMEPLAYNANPRYRFNVSLNGIAAKISSRYRFNVSLNGIAAKAPL